MTKRNDDFVSVSVRIKPTLAEERCLEFISQQPPILVVPEKSQTFHFDNVFSEEVEQETVYNETVKHLVKYVKSGYNCTVFAYGQTGTGKTFTMGTNSEVSYTNQSGLIPRTLEDFFNITNEDEESQIYVSFIEIYNEKVFDLLADNHRIPLTVKGFTVHGVQKMKVLNTRTGLDYLKQGCKNRHTGGTKQNSQSSRSHAIFTIYSRVRNSDSEFVAKLNLVDLAGSESVRKTGNQGNSFHEGININKGLLSLGQVMTALSTNATHIPYRQSIVTTILQDSLSRKNYISLIACVNPNPEDLGETLQTLEFSQRVKRMKNKPEINQFISQYKKDNPSLLANNVSRLATPLKRSNPYSYDTPFKMSRMPVIQEPTNSTIDNSEFDSPKSLSSASMVSISSAVQQNISPVIRKYVQEMEHSIITKMQDLINNSVRKPAQSSRENENKENCLTPSFSWNKVAKVVRSEMLQFSARASRATSSPVEEYNEWGKSKTNATIKPRKLLDDEDCTISSLENSITEEKTSIQDYRQTSRKNDSDEIFKKPMPKKSKISKDPRRSSLRLQMKNVPHEQTIEKGRRRSVRLQIKEVNASKNGLDTSIEMTRSRRKSKQQRLTLNTSSFNWANEKIQNIRKMEVTLMNSPMSVRTKKVLDTLNNGTIRDLERLHTIGLKTAEKIELFRQMKGKFNSISDMTEMPYWSKRKHEKFLAENFLRNE